MIKNLVAERSFTAGVVSITPFRDDGAVDEAGLRTHLSRLGAAGLGVWVGGSGSSEGYTLTDDEVERVLRIAVEELSGKVPVRAMGREPRTPAEMVAWVKRFQHVGVDAIQIYSLDPGHLYKPREDEIEAYLNEVLESVEVPAVLSAHMSVGYLPPVPLVMRLCERFPLIDAINISGVPQSYLRAAVETLSGRIKIISGGVTQVVDNLAFGGNGYASSEANLTPQLCASFVQHVSSGDISAAFDVHKSLTALSDILMSYGYVTGLKAVLELAGLPGGPPRKPRHRLSDRELGELKTKIAELQLAELVAYM